MDKLWEDLECSISVREPAKNQSPSNACPHLLLGNVCYPLFSSKRLKCGYKTEYRLWVVSGSPV